MTNASAFALTQHEPHVTAQGPTGKGTPPANGKPEKPTSGPIAPTGGKQNTGGSRPAKHDQAYYEDANLDVQRSIADYTKKTVDLTNAAVTLTEVAVGVSIIETIAFLFTVYLTYVATKAANRSAKASEDALASADRPHVTIQTITLGGIHKGPEVEKNEIKIGYNFANYGEDLAFLRSQGLRFFTEKKGVPLPEPETIEISTMYWPLATRQGWGSDVSKPGAGAMVMNEESRARLLDGEDVLFCSGVISYTDIAAQSHESRFIYVYRLSDFAMVPFDDERYWKYT